MLYVFYAGECKLTCASVNQYDTVRHHGICDNQKIIIKTRTTASKIITIFSLYEKRLKSFK